jgi:dephospho-CoA kinase
MFVLGLTGSIGMGKSETARMFRRLGVPVYDADAAVHRLLGPGGAAVGPVGQAFPGVVRDGRVDRAALGARVFNDPPALKRLEAIVHPLVGQAQRRFLARAARRRRPLVVLDVPLLFETGGEARTDAIAVVSAPVRLQRQRVLGRPAMSRAKLDGILAQQLPDRLKRQRADFVIPTGLGRRPALLAVRRIVTMLRHRPGQRWPPRARPRPRPARHPSRRAIHARSRARH